MSATHEFGFLLAIGGVLLVLEGATTGIAKMLIRFLPEWSIKLIAGAIIVVTGLWNMLTAPYVTGIP